MDRNCDKCIHHTSGMCSSWDCKMQTVEDVKKEAVKEYVEAVVAELEKYMKASEKDYVLFQLTSALGEMRAFEKAISIVRGKE